MTPADVVLHVRPDLLQEVLDGDVVLLDPADGLLHVLAGTAAAVWDVLQAGGTAAEVAHRVTTDFGRPDDASATADVVRFLTDLRELRLVVPVA